MNTSHSDDDIIAAFMKEFEIAADKQPIIALFAERFPQLGRSFFADYASGRSLMNEAAVSYPTSQRLKPGEMLGDFRIVREVDRGGQGEIYEAKQLHLSERRVAVKVIRQGKVSAAARDRFLREQKALAKLHQSNILPAFAAGERGEIQYFAMPYVDGANLGHVVHLLRTRSRQPGASATSSLAKIVKDAGDEGCSTAPTASESPSTPAPDMSDAQASPTLTNEYLRSVAASLAEVADALHAAHQANLVHRDVKPANMMVERETGKCWLIDFGLAGLIGESTVGRIANPSYPDVDPSLTDTGSIMGTWAYMAPEQFDGQPERRSDIWALGVTLYELLTLRRPFPGPTLNEYKQQVHQLFPGRPRQLANVPNDLDAICMKAMQKDASNRYATAQNFANDLRHWLNTEPTIANPPWAGRRVAMWARRQPGWASMVGVACLALIAVTLLLIQGERFKTQTAQAKVAEAETNASRESERATSAELEIGLRKRSEEMSEFTKERLSPHMAGWRDRLWAKGVKLAEGGKEPELRDQMAALLSGLDARLVPNFKEGSATAVAFDPTGKRLFMAGYGDHRDPKISTPTRVRHLDTNEVKTSKQEEVDAIGWRGATPVQLVPPTLERPTYMLWDVDRNQPIEEFRFPKKLQPIPNAKVQLLLALAAQFMGINASLSGPTIAHAAMSADATHVATLLLDANGNRRILVWRAGNPVPVTTVNVLLERRSEFGEQIALSADGSLIALGTGDGQVSVWSLIGETRLVTKFNLSRSRITVMTFARHRHVTEPERRNPNGVAGWLLAAGDAGGQIAVWDLGRLERVSQSRESHNEVFALVFSPDATTLYSTGRRQCRSWDVSSGRQLLQIQVDHSNVIIGIAMRTLGDRFAVCAVPAFGYEGGVRVFALDNGPGVDVLRGLTGPVKRLSITPDGKRVAAITQDWLVGVWDRETTELLMSAELNSVLYAEHADVRLSDDGRFLVVASGTEAKRWELPLDRTGLPRLSDTWKLAPSATNRLAIRADGRSLLARTESLSGKIHPFVHPATDPRCVRMYELLPGAQPEHLATQADHAWQVFDMFASPDASVFLVTGLRTQDKSTHTAIAYAGQTGEQVWSIDLSKSPGDGGAMMDSSGQYVWYTPDGRTRLIRSVAWPKEPDRPTGWNQTPLLGLRYAVSNSCEGAGLKLSVPGSDSYSLRLSPDSQPSTTFQTITADGLFLVWGSGDGSVHVAELPTLRERLVSVGLPGW